ncbi:Uncharacterized protein TCM_024071 [Theobroma cacao]|uniref:Uncharacterized protein n=1 Tax=Theobroma cacao TaxID=3641 RepID=A0A061EW07_THECC|nr:Uncharacterized protein TCM_024071 [Theobroma cacao]
MTRYDARRQLYGQSGIILQEFEAQSRESGNDQKGELPKQPFEVQHLLDGFKELVSEELPSVLPPIRRVQLAIGSVPAASLPNVPAYRMPLLQ